MPLSPTEILAPCPIFAQLEPDQTFKLVNDHDPKPLSQAVDDVPVK